LPPLFITYVRAACSLHAMTVFRVASVDSLQKIPFFQVVDQCLDGINTGIDLGGKTETRFELGVRSDLVAPPALRRYRYLFPEKAVFG